MTWVATEAVLSYEDGSDQATDSSRPYVDGIAEFSRNYTGWIEISEDTADAEVHRNYTADIFMILPGRCWNR